jgi:hypothetical protein
MSWQQEWRKVLDLELQRWSAKSNDELLFELQREGHQAYEVELDSRKYQVEVELLENTESYLHVALAVDDGILPRSIHPLTESLIRHKD